MVFVSHDAEAVERVCDRAVLLEHGELMAEGRPGDVLATYRRALVREAVPSVDAGAAEASDEWGTRTVAIAAVRTVGPGGPTDRFESDGPLAIEIDFVARERVGDAALRRRDPRRRRDPLLRDEHPPRHLPGRVGGGARAPRASPSTACRCTRGASC